MAFFGLPERDLGPNNPEDLAVYTWGEDSYDGLGDALQEGGDDLNDETFGSAGPIGNNIESSYVSFYLHPYQAKISTSRIPPYQIPSMSIVSLGRASVDSRIFREGKIGLNLSNTHRGLLSRVCASSTSDIRIPF